MTISRPTPEYHFSRHGPFEATQERFTLAGEVLGIEALHYDVHEVTERSRPMPGSVMPGTVYAKTPGTERLTAVDSDRRWELEPSAEEPSESFAGWIVEVEAMTLEPIEYEDDVQEYRPKALDSAVKWFRGRRRSTSA